MRKPVLTPLLLGALLLPLMFSVPLRAQEAGSISTGRPSFATGPGVVRRLQLEAGYQLTTGPDADEHALGQLLFRVPLIRAAELRLGLGSYAVSGPSGARETGIEDITVGTKIRVADSDGSVLRPAVAVIVATSLPTGSDGFGSDAAQPGANLILSWSLLPGIDLLSNTLVRSRSAAGERSAEYAQVAGVGLDVPGPAGLFAEVYTVAGDGRIPSTSAGAGLTWALSRDFQLDLHGGAGLSTAAPDYYFGFGIGRRW